METKQHNVRLPPALAQAIERAVQERGYTSASALIRTAIQRELGHAHAATSDCEERIAAALNRLSRDLRRVHTAQMATFAFTDCLAKVFLTCVPEPPVDILEQAKSRAMRRYQKFLVSVAKNMAGEARAALRELSDATD
jgi:Arc/MetJ-type ribon-helix-helix transcriptional regulator